MRRIDRPTLDDINDTITSNLVPALLRKEESSDFSTPRYSSLIKDITYLSSHPGYKFLDIKSSPQTAAASVEYTFDSWKALIKNIEGMQYVGTPSEAIAYRNRSFQSEKYSVRNYPPSSSARIPRQWETSQVFSTPHCVNVASLVILRGLDSAAVTVESKASPESASDADSKTVDQKIPIYISHAYWTDPRENIRICTSPHFVNGYKRSVCLISNGQTVLPYLRRTLGRAGDMFEVGAYVHQYTSMGLQIDDFIDSFNILGQSAENYRSLSG
jgi:hypothetical protein